MKIRGRIWTFGNNVNTDEIIPARYLNTTVPEELAAHCMEDADPEFPKKVKKGDLIVAGTNFGCGSSREHAPRALLYAGVSCVVAASFARIFLRNAINTGLCIVECPEAVKDTQTGDTLSVDVAAGEVKNERTGKVCRFPPFPKEIMEIVNAGGLMPFVKRQTTSRKS